jgi:hypothetical protein
MNLALVESEVPSKVPPHEELYQYHVPLAPFVPPVCVKVVEKLGQPAVTVAAVPVGAIPACRTTTVAEVALLNLHDAVALAVYESAATNADNPDSVQAFELTVVVPAETPFLKTSMVVPFASVEVPLIEVDPEHKDETVGAAEDVV